MAKLILKFELFESHNEVFYCLFSLYARYLHGDGFHVSLYAK